MIATTRRFLALCLASCLGVVQSAQAIELIGAEAVVRATAQPDARERLQRTLDRADVAAALAERGVAVDEARARVAALTEAEAAWLQAEIDRAPAGASGEVIGTLVLVFVVLVFSDILGFTRIFPFLRPAR